MALPYFSRSQKSKIGQRVLVVGAEGILFSLKTLPCEKVNKYFDIFSTADAALKFDVELLTIERKDEL